MEPRARSKSPKLMGAESRNSATPMIESAAAVWRAGGQRGAARGDRGRVPRWGAGGGRQRIVRGAVGAGGASAPGVAVIKKAVTA